MITTSYFSSGPPSGLGTILPPDVMRVLWECVILNVSTIDDYKSLARTSKTINDVCKRHKKCIRIITRKANYVTKLIDSCEKAKRKDKLNLLKKIYEYIVENKDYFVFKNFQTSLKKKLIEHWNDINYHELKIFNPTVYLDKLFPTMLNK